MPLTRYFFTGCPVLPQTATTRPSGPASIRGLEVITVGPKECTNASFIRPLDRTGEPLPASSENDREEKDDRSQTAIMPTDMPEKMTRRTFKESSAMTAQTQAQLLDAAIDRRQENADIQTVFFVNLKPEGLQGEVLLDLQSLVNNVGSCQTWASSLAAIKTQERINSGALSNATDGDSTAIRSASHSMVFDYLMRESTW